MESFDSLTNFYTFNSGTEIRDSAISSEETSSIWKKYNNLVQGLIYLYLIQSTNSQTQRICRNSTIRLKNRISIINHKNLKITINISQQGKVKIRCNYKINPMHKYLAINYYIRNESEDSTNDFFSMLEEIKNSSIYFVYYIEEDEHMKVGVIFKVDNSQSTLKKLTNMINLNANSMRSNLIEIKLYADFSQAAINLKRKYESCIIHSNLEQDYLNSLLGGTKLKGFQ